MPDSWVYFTHGGGKWHQRADCEALAHGQQEARDRGLSTHQIRHAPLLTLEGRPPCGWCVHDALQPDSDTVLSTIRTDTEYERIFLDQVLGKLPELTGWTISGQQEVVLDGRTYRPDFTLTQGAHRIAIEVDGEHKGSNAPSHDEWTRRQNAFVTDGWEVLRFTNRDVRQQQEKCRLAVAVTVARLRERSRHSGSDIARLASTPLPVALVPRDSPVPKPRGRAPLALGVAAIAIVFAGGLWVTLRPDPSGGVAPTESTNGFVSCPTSHPIKGNVSASGARIYWVPGSSLFTKTRPERCFDTTQAAEAAGFRAPKS